MVNVLNYASTNITNSAYVTLVTLTDSFAHLCISDTSGQLMKLAIGAAGSEVDFCAFDGNGYPVVIPVTQFVPGTRISIKAISTSASTGYNLTSYLR